MIIPRVTGVVPPEAAANVIIGAGCGAGGAGGSGCSGGLSGDVGFRKLIRHVPAGIGVEQAVMDDRHRYVTPAGRTYDSVTTILGATKPDADRRQLEAWRQRVGAGVADHIVQEAARTGTQAHRLNEWFLNGYAADESDYEGEAPFGLLAHAHHALVAPHVARHVDMVRGTEIVMHSDVMRVAGTADVIAEYDGVLSVIDYKTKRSAQKAEWLHDYFVQAAAYSVMYEEMTAKAAAAAAGNTDGGNGNCADNDGNVKSNGGGSGTGAERRGVRIGQSVIVISSERNTLQVVVSRTAPYVDEFVRRVAEYAVLQGRRPPRWVAERLSAEGDTAPTTQSSIARPRLLGDLGKRF